MGPAEAGSVSWAGGTNATDATVSGSPANGGMTIGWVLCATPATGPFSASSVAGAGFALGSGKDGSAPAGSARATSACVSPGSTVTAGSLCATGVSGTTRGPIAPGRGRLTPPPSTPSNTGSWPGCPELGAGAPSGWRGYNPGSPARRSCPMPRKAHRPPWHRLWQHW